jgi:hypothetical protein
MPEEQVQSLLQEALEARETILGTITDSDQSTDPSTLTVMNAMDKRPFHLHWGQ